ncbi:MAG: 6-phosphofructokinase [Clostridiales bacterium]|nr:6-phosphofructokinase [Clostridiales bacterium]
MNTKIKKIGILTSGGDAPGMNAVIRAVTRTALYYGIEVVGIKRGYEGLLHAEIVDLKARGVSEILQRGGTILLTARSEEMKTPEGQKRAADICNVLGIDALVVIGGDGSINGAIKLAGLGIKVMAVPATIDLDIPCSEYTIGFDTAVTTVMNAIGKIRDTSSSHERCSIVEVMGRNAGHIAYWCALTGGAEDVVVPEHKKEDYPGSIIKQILENRSKGKTHNLIIVAEGVGGSQQLAAQIEEMTGISSRATILGHLQRGGSPTVVDRMHASIMGHNVVKMLLEGLENRIVIYKGGRYSSVPLEDVNQEPTKANVGLYDIIKILAI